MQQEQGLHLGKESLPRSVGSRGVPIFVEQEILQERRVHME